jgi:hypothetical protein
MYGQTENRPTRKSKGGRRPKDLSGQVFSRLTVLEYSHVKEHEACNQRTYFWRCVCECGKEIITSSKSLLRGSTRSCGCLRVEWIKAHHKKTHGQTGSVEYKLLDGARQRAKKFGRECNLELADIIIPEYCPFLGIPLVKGEGKQHANSPTLDRIDSTKGYTKDNVWVISHKANSFKQDKTIEELEHFVRVLKTKTNTS